MDRNRRTSNDAPEALFEVAQGVAGLAAWDDLELAVDAMERAS
jgi:hypothetical protein